MRAGRDVGKAKFPPGVQWGLGARKGGVDLSAPVKLIPRPPTLVVSRKMSMASLLLKSSTRRERSATGVVPSMRWYLRPAASTVLSRMSSICCVWVNTRARCPCPCQASKTYSQHGKTVARPFSITSLHRNCMKALVTERLVMYGSA